MDDLRKAVAALQNSSPDDRAIALATVVNTKGSVYRRAGARMIVRQSGRIEGSISAGCLERNVAARCEDLTKPTLIAYDGASDDDLVFGLNLGCNGVIELFLEPLQPISSVMSMVPLVSDLLARNVPMSAVTVFSVIGGANDSLLGLALIQTNDSSIVVHSFPQGIQSELIALAKLALESRQSSIASITEGDVQLRALVEFVDPTISLMIIGNGQEVSPLQQMARILGWNVMHNSFQSPTTLASRLSETSFSAAVVVTHDYRRDKEALSSLIKTDIQYLGIAGPKRRTQKLLAELAVEGVPMTASNLSRIHGPIGLDIGAEDPAEIALSIISEIKAVIKGHRAGFLKDKDGPIHDGQTSSMLSAGETTSIACRRSASAPATDSWTEV